MSDKKTVWFVRDGRMHSSWIIGHVDINVGVEDSESYTDETEVLHNVFARDANHIAEHNEHTRSIQKHVRVNDFVERPGRWYFLSGVQVMHGDDLHSTREAAAEAYKEFLLGDK